MLKFIIINIRKSYKKLVKIFQNKFAKSQLGSNTIIYK